MTDFEQFELPDFLMRSLAALNITTPTPIQAQSIPFGLEGRDVLATAQTGTGKTFAYSIPLVCNLLEQQDSIALILVPTRELAMQVSTNLKQLLGKNPAFPMALLIGGEPMPKQFQELRRNPRIIIGTPGRVTDHLKRKSLKLSNAKFLVLDEIDRMLDIGFSEQLEDILPYLAPVRQTFMFSATLPSSIVKLSQKYLTNPERITVGSTTEPTAHIEQETINVSASDKFSHLLKEVDKREGSIIIFVKTKRSADQISDKLSRSDHASDAIHGDLRQRMREKVITNFRNSKIRIMVATDVAARGLDVPHIMHVINYDLPQCPEDYIHRIGRTGRAGKKGFALSLISPDDSRKWRDIKRLMDPNSKDEPSRGGEGRGRSRSGGGRSSGGRSRSGGGWSPNAGNERRRSDSRDSRPARGGDFRSERSERPARGGDFKSERSERPARGGDFRSERSERPARGGDFRSERSERPARSGDFRSERSERPARSGDFRSERSERPARGGDFRAERSERPARGGDFRAEGRPSKNGNSRFEKRGGNPARTSQNNRRTSSGNRKMIDY